MGTSPFSVIKTQDLTKESRRALIQHVSVLRNSKGSMPSPDLLSESMGDRFGEILYIEEFIAGGKQGLFVTFASTASRNDFIKFTNKLKNPSDPLFSIRCLDRSVDAYSLLKWYNIPLSLEKVLAIGGYLKFTPESASKGHQSGNHSMSSMTSTTEYTSLRRDSATNGTSLINSSSSFLKLPSHPVVSHAAPSTSVWALPMGISSTSSLGTKTITFDELRKTMSSNPSSLASSHQNPSSNSYSQTWERTHQTSAFAPDDFELKTSSDHSGIGKVATAAPPISASLPKKPKIKVEESSPDVSQSQNTAKGGTKAQSYLDESAAYGEQLKVLSELQKTQEKLAKARTRFNEVRSQAAITKTLLEKEEKKRKEAENKARQLQEAVEALSSCKKEVKRSEVEVQTLSPTLSQKSTQTGQKRPMEHASTQTVFENPNPIDVTPTLEELRQGEIENEYPLDQLKLAHAGELTGKLRGIRGTKLEENSELKRQMLAHMQKFAEVSAELEQLRSTQRESEDALQRQRKDHAEQLTGLRGEMEARKIEALAARFPAASKLLIAAYIRLEILGKRKREDGEEDV